MIFPRLLAALIGLVVCATAAAAAAAPFVEYKVLGVNDLGMHCVDDDYSTMTILPLFNVVQSQIVGIDSNGVPRLLTGADQVELIYRATKDVSGSVNGSWKDRFGNPKTNFWQYQSAYGLSLPDGQGIFGLTMPKDGTRRAHRLFAPPSDVDTVFTAVGIPITPIDDAGRKNPYPMLQLVARDSKSHADLPGGKTKVVLPVSDETTCANCHATGKRAANPKNAKYAGVVWSTNPNASVAYRENVLKLHDFKHGTALEASKPVLCAGCHFSLALDLKGQGPDAEQQKHRTMSAVMHDFHASKMVLNGIRLSDEAVPVGGTVPPADEQSCYQCHPGTDTRCLRGAMTEQVTCQNCHGGMAATGGRYALKPGGSIDGENDGGQRRPWQDMPRCQSCHTGDEVDHAPTTAANSPDGLRLQRAFASGDLSASPLLAVNKRFAENPDTLYRHSKGHGEILCENCHNSTHAIAPSDPEHPNDDVAAITAQGHAGTLIECTACHRTQLPMNLNGPHGMHPVADRRWFGGGHGDLAEHDRGSCQTCHGMDFRGSPLGRVAVDRVFKTGDFGTVTYKKGDEVTCYDCHNGPRGD